jgi:hypothetical protein
MREIAEIELAIQGGTEKIEVYGLSHSLLLSLWRSGKGKRRRVCWMITELTWLHRRARQSGRVHAGDAGH